MRFLRFWWEFVAGDDPIVVVGVVLAIAGTAALARADFAAWWLIPLAVVVVLYVSLRSAK